MTNKDLEVKPYRKTQRQTSIILNVSVRTVRRMLEEDGRLEWSGNQVSVESIVKELQRQRPDDDKSVEDIEREINEITKPPARKRRRREEWYRRRETERMLEQEIEGIDFDIEDILEIQGELEQVL